MGLVVVLDPMSRNRPNFSRFLTSLPPFDPRHWQYVESGRVGCTREPSTLRPPLHSCLMAQYESLGKHSCPEGRAEEERPASGSSRRSSALVGR
jgi:hypothetical protein